MKSVQFLEFCKTGRLAVLIISDCIECRTQKIRIDQIRNNNFVKKIDNKLQTRIALLLKYIIY
jgi:hypothetical protein